MRRLAGPILLHVAGLAAVVALFHLTDLDLRCQDLCYDFSAGRWLVDKDAPVPRWILYHGAKGLVIAIGVACGAGFVLSFRVRKLRRNRRRLLLMAASLGLVPLLVSGLKLATDVHTPRRVMRYGGTVPYAKPLAHWPAGYRPPKRGEGFPAGHAAGGFALMMLAVALRGRRARDVGLAFALSLGWAMALYQTFNGQHYLSHSLVTMSLAWIVVLLLRASVRWRPWRRRVRAAAPA